MVHGKQRVIPGVAQDWTGSLTRVVLFFDV